eukprot:TRINITY_DN6497_c0_g1_i1.p1 TRINITY_DN6497_c0_g1~~TRINITY_DN6497_c0_g1_i1.p1  ORF type:complete len:588 (+),score=105.17 TRINITY_DN6497_c0_g1_i1:75-1766(+)
MKLCCAYLVCFLAILCVSQVFAEQIVECDVVIAGGTTAALSSALTSSSEGAYTCLLEPTNWVGGQITASGVPAIDFAWHTLKNGNFVLPVYEIDRNQSNVSPIFYDILHKLNVTGDCWVSDFCFPPSEFLRLVGQYIAKLPTLRIFYQTVVKSVETKPTGENGTSIIVSMTGIQRTPQPGVECDGYDIRPSQDIPDWYSPKNSSRWIKETLIFVAPVFIEATEWGEVLALGNASYLQGIDERFDGDTSGLGGSETCGQAFTFGFVETFDSKATYEPPNPYSVPYPSHYSVAGYGWRQVWTYRRIIAAESNGDISTGDVSLQNWDDGNDFPYRYLFFNKTVTQSTVDDWMGGVDLVSMDEAEREAIGYHYWYKNQTYNSNNQSLASQITLNGTYMGTCHGLSKVPYIRDTRRAIGIDSFVMTVDNISGNATDLVGYYYPDTLAIGCYDVDIHRDVGCTYPSYMNDYYPVLPYYIPFRAMTSRELVNLVVAGKTMAQSFLTNSATRLHPVEWSSGSGAGVAAAFMARSRTTTTAEALKNIEIIQSRVQNYTPIKWTIWGKEYPPS